MDDYKKPTRGANAYDPKTKQWIIVTVKTPDAVAQRAIFGVTKKQVEHFRPR